MQFVPYEDDTVTFARANHLLAALLVACLYVAHALPAYAFTTDEVVQEIMGATVYAADGHEVGKVVDVSVSNDGEIGTVRFKTGAFLGFGEHVLDVPKGDYTALRGAVVLDVPAESLESLRPAPLGGMAEDRED
ncbi:MAG: PRC-barrel domain-containing protein [Hyphomicrobiaceae bacterium]